MRWRRFILVSRAAAALAAALMAPGVADAGQLAGSGEGLQMLRKIQGQWQSECQELEGLYQRQSLNFSFTHLRQRTQQYSDSSCTQVVNEQADSYRYTLLGPMETNGGERAHALNLKPEEGLPASTQRHPLNLIQYSNGALRLGDADSASTNERLSALDSSTPFTRP